MSIKDILLATYIALSKLPKSKLLKTLQSLREKYIELEETITQLKAENIKLKEQLKSEKIKSVNKNANKPSSKQAEWEEKGVGNDGKGKSKGKGRGRKPRRGAGNRAKNAEPTRTEKATIDECSLCLWCLDKLIHFRSDKMRRWFTQQRKKDLVSPRLLPRPLMQSVTPPAAYPAVV